MSDALGLRLGGLEVVPPWQTNEPTPLAATRLGEQLVDRALGGISLLVDRAGLVVSATDRSRKETGDHLLHRVERTAQQDMVLAETLLGAAQEIIDFGNEGFQQRAIIRRRRLGEQAKGGRSGKSQSDGEFFAEGVPFLASRGDERNLRVDCGQILEKTLGRTADDQLELLFEEREEFAVLREFFTKHPDQVIEDKLRLALVCCGFHGQDLTSLNVAETVPTSSSV